MPKSCDLSNYNPLISDPLNTIILITITCLMNLSMYPPPAALRHIWGYSGNLTCHMWPDLRKPDIMVHTKISSINHYKNLVQKMHFIKYLKWTYKGHNLAMLTWIAKPRHHRAPYHVRSTKIFKSFLYCNVFDCHEH